MQQIMGILLLGAGGIGSLITTAADIPVIELRAPAPNTAQFINTQAPKIIPTKITPIRSQQSYIDDINNLRAQLRDTALQRDKALSELAEARQQLATLKASTYTQNDVDTQRSTLLQQLAQIQSSKDREIQDLKNRILQLTKAESTPLTIPSIKPPAQTCQK